MRRRARHHQRCAGLRVVDYLAPEAVDGLDQFLGNDGGRIALRDNGSGLQGDDLFGLPAGVIEVEQLRDHGAVLFAVEDGEQVEQFHLVRDVEKGRRLVE